MWQLIIAAPFVLNQTPMTIDLVIGTYNDEKSCVMMQTLLSNPHSGMIAGFECRYVKIETM